jgi:snRNA-activating protein complex (SNAPc), subunit 3
LAVPPTYVLADWVADDFVERWRELDQRKISANDVVVDDDDTLQNDTNDGGQLHDDSQQRQTKRPKRTPLPRWYEKHVRLPEQFDYATQQTEPPSPDDDDDRVISLDDPDATTSYHTELWKLFRDIPRVQQLDEEAVAGHCLAHMEQLHNEINQGRTCTTNLDGHALSRLRMNDRHDLPPPPPPSCMRTAIEKRGGGARIGTLRVECWRQQLRRGSTPDSNRMVLECLGSQTLLDLHTAVVELTHDELLCPPHGADMNTTTTDAGDGAAVDIANNNNNNTDDATQDAVSSGYFFIEGIFYVTGSVDYTSPILEWLASGNEREQKRRLSYLGISTQSLPSVRPMADIRLDEIACRLGVRYVHVHHGDVECAMFVTDRRFVSKETASKIQFPIIHDIWTPSYTIPECEVCQNRPAAVATSTTCQVTGGHRALCEACCRQLKLPITARDKIKRYSLWRGQADLSAGASGNTTW